MLACRRAIHWRIRAGLSKLRMVALSSWVNACMQAGNSPADPRWTQQEHLPLPWCLTAHGGGLACKQTARVLLATLADVSYLQ